MPLISLAFLCGIVLLQQFSQLPSLDWIAWIILSILILSIFNLNYTKLIIATLIGFAWCLWYASAELQHQLPTELEGKTIHITGNIASIPKKSRQRTTFLFSLKRIGDHPARGLVQLSWQTHQNNLHAGDTWEFAVRLKKIHGNANPGGFDYEAWSFQSGIMAHGYIVDKIQPKKLNERIELNRIREYFRDQIAENLPKSNTSHWITALAIGERYGIRSSDWEVLRNTGTNHLMAIAGLHIGFMSAFVFGLCAWCWRRIPALTLKIPAQQAGGVAALFMSLIYSAMAGFSIPTQRACLMFLVFLTILLFRRKLIAWQAWSLALLIVLLINPLSVLTESFWLSFGSVALIIYGMNGRLAPSGLWWKHGRIQWVIAMGLIPLSIWLFHECSLVSFMANSIAIPWVGFLIVPLTLLGCFCLLFSAKAGGFFLILADKLLQLLWSILAYLAHFSWASWHHVIPNTWYLAAACMGMVLLLLPTGFKGRWLGAIWLLPLCLYHAPAPKPGELWFTLLDVGQGLSAVIQTQHHSLVFDTGAKLSDNYDMGESVALPFLRYQGLRKLDMLVVSHGDNDHSGGARAILQKFPVKALKSSVPEQFSPFESSYCLAGETWYWDKIEFKFLYPSMTQLGLGNDSSCVLRIRSGNQVLILAGDIEKQAENYLVENNAAELAADILVAPHHGSKTSAVDSFLDAVHPKIVLFPMGYRNRYHFPHPSVVHKYKKRHVLMHDSVHSGAIQYHIDNNTISAPRLYRIENTHYWNTTQDDKPGREHHLFAIMNYN